jgi:hypothetical protein
MAHFRYISQNIKQLQKWAKLDYAFLAMRIHFNQRKGMHPSLKMP